MASTKNYIKGTFANNRTNQFGTTEINIDFTDEAIEHLKSLPKDAKGNRKITIAPQKDPSKSSVYENTFIPKSNAGGSSESSGLPF
jgi:hypothetical protein